MDGLRVIRSNEANNARFPPRQQVRALCAAAWEAWSTDLRGRDIECALVHAGNARRCAVAPLAPLAPLAVVRGTDDEVSLHRVTFGSHGVEAPVCISSKAEPSRHA